ncbi:MAG: hypothetical protein ACE5EA_10430 [Nitrospirota bacterium]
MEIMEVNLMKVLTDLTGEVKPETALREVLKDAVEHRLEKIDLKIKRFEQKYKFHFEEFDENYRKEEIPDQYSYEVESDYLEWEGLISRKRHILRVLNRLFDY